MNYSYIVNKKFKAALPKFQTVCCSVELCPALLKSHKNSESLRNIKRINAAITFLLYARVVTSHKTMRMHFEIFCNIKFLMFALVISLGFP